MPTYQYVCTECGGQVEAVQRFTDDPLTMHDDCGGRLRKVYSAVGIVFKGSGFYRTDSRSGAGSSLSASSSSADSGSSGAGSADSGSPSPAEVGKSVNGDKKPVAAAASASGSAGKVSEKVA